MQKAIFYWNKKLDGSLDIKLGSDGVRLLDGRLRCPCRIEEEVQKGLKVSNYNNDIIGYSIGYLTSHDPNNVYNQKIQRFTAI